MSPFFGKRTGKAGKPPNNLLRRFCTSSSSRNGFHVVSVFNSHDSFLVPEQSTSIQRGARRVLRNLVQILRYPEQPKNEEPLAIPGACTTFLAAVIHGMKTLLDRPITTSVKSDRGDAYRRLMCGDLIGSWCQLISHVRRYRRSRTHLPFPGSLVRTCTFCMSPISASCRRRP